MNHPLNAEMQHSSIRAREDSGIEVYNSPKTVQTVPTSCIGTYKVPYTVQARDEWKHQTSNASLCEGHQII
jgi:hypothetical protein